MYETREEKIALVKQLIVDVTARSGVEVTVEYEDSLASGLVFNISTPDPQLLIGRQGSHLHALQILIQALVAKKLSGSPEPIYFSIDVDDYKRKREWFLKQTAKQAVEQLKRTGRPVSLEPMPNYDRRLIHVYLQDNHPEVITDSVGFEPNRKIVLKFKDNSESDPII